MEAVAHDAGARCLLWAVAMREAAAMAIAAIFDAGDQHVLGRLGSGGIMATVAACHFGLMCCMSEFGVDEKGLRQLDGLDMPEKIGSGNQPRYGMASGAGATFKQVLRNIECLYTGLGSRAITLGTRQCLSGASQSLFDRSRVTPE